MGANDWPRLLTLLLNLAPPFSVGFAPPPTPGGSRRVCRVGIELLPRAAQRFAAAPPGACAQALDPGSEQSLCDSTESGLVVGHHVEYAQPA